MNEREKPKVFSATDTWGGDTNHTEPSRVFEVPASNEPKCDHLRFGRRADRRYYCEDCGRKMEVVEPIRNREPRPLRNDSCPCGSGRKFKRCCGLSAS